MNAPMASVSWRTGVNEPRRMACFSASHDELGLVGVPTTKRGKPRMIQLGADMDKDDGFGIKITYSLGFLNNDGATGPVNIERIVAKLENIGLTVSRGASVY